LQVDLSTLGRENDTLCVSVGDSEEVRHERGNGPLHGEVTLELPAHLIGLEHLVVNVLHMP
jgi:hypothetical protein